MRKDFLTGRNYQKGLFRKVLQGGTHKEGLVRKDLSGRAHREDVIECKQMYTGVKG